MSGLEATFLSARPMPLSDDARIVILSDLHLGNGGGRDDCVHNAPLCLSALRDYYLPRGCHLILNGDVEELQRYRLDRVRAAWPEFYRLLDGFRAGGGLTRLEGNHDGELSGRGETEVALRLELGEDTLFVLHGHQAAALYSRANPLVGFVLRYLANPLRIGNRSVAHSSERRFSIERRVYEFSSRRRIASVIGHTHRPLFESMSKADSLKYRIELPCRRYPEATSVEREHLEAVIGALRAELQHQLRKQAADALPSSLYDAALHVPCLGRSGITNLEISGGRISLVHWFDASQGRRSRLAEGGAAAEIRGTPFRRVVLKEDNLSYIFTRIRLLAAAYEPPEPTPYDEQPLAAAQLWVPEHLSV